MASGSNVEGVQESHSFPSQSQTPRFFKIVVNPKDHRLRIPRNFVRRYGHTLSSNKVYLKAPNGPIREVGLVHSDGDTWLKKGWKDFRDYYSIKFGHLLVFQYAGTSHFDVLIFDMSATEIEYPLPHNAVGDEGITNLRKSNGRRVPETVPINSYESFTQIDDNSIPHFEVVLANHQKSRLYIHKHFAEATGLIGRSSVSLEYEGGFRVDDVELRNRNKVGARCTIPTLELAAGWSEFCKNNDLVVGKTYSFEFIPNRCVIRVKPFEI